MALKVYQSANPSTSFSTDGEFSNPVRHTFDGRTGGVIEQRYYVRNDDPLIWSSGIVVSLSDDQGRSIINGTDGYSWKLKAGDTQPLDQEWATIDEADPITLSNITNTTTYLPFWVRIEVPRGAVVESFDDVKIVLTSNDILL